MDEDNSAGYQARYTSGARSLTDRFGGEWLGRHGVNPDLVTLLGTALTITAAFIWAAQLYWPPAFWIGLLIAIPGGLFDIIDGSVARHGRGPTQFGAFLDSVTDRGVETMMFTVLAWVLVRQHAGAYAAGGCALALGGSFLVTYTRAKAESLGLSGKAGFGARAERLVLLGIMVLAARLLHFGYQYAAYAVAGLAWFTVVQRTVSVKRQLKNRGTP